MHNYLRSIGFSKIKKRKDLDPIIQEVIDNYDDKKIVYDEDGQSFVEFSKLYSEHYGITVCGEIGENDDILEEYYFPFFHGTGISTSEDIIIEKHFSHESYSGACDDIRVGVTLMFFIQNASQCKDKMNDKKELLSVGTSVTLSGLSTSGMVLLPILKSPVQSNSEKNASSIRNNLIAAARNGDEDAMENLTIDDLDTYTMISRRIRNEDVFSIVDSYFMPYGMECDLYNVMGEIKSYTTEVNTCTEELVYVMSIECNDIIFDISINSMDLVGSPEIGRRFKGVIWLQGYINFKNKKK